MGLEKHLALIRELGKGLPEEAVRKKVRKQTLERLLGEEDNAVSGVSRNVSEEV